MKASEQPTPIPAFAMVKRVDLLDAKGDEEVLELELELELEERVSGVCTGGFDFVIVEVLELFWTVANLVAGEVLVLLLLLLSALAMKPSVFEVEGVLVVLGFCTTGAWIWLGLEREADDVDARDGSEPADCMLKTRP